MPAIGSVHKATMTYGDVTQETSTMAIFVAPITVLTLAAFLADFGDLQTATDAITLGTRRKQSWIGDETTVTNAWPTDRAAQREAKLKINYQDVVTEKPYFITIPTVDFSKLNFVSGGGDFVEFKAPAGNADLIAWVAAFETLGRAPDNDTHNVVVTSVEFVGANT